MSEVEHDTRSAMKTMLILMSAGLMFAACEVYVVDTTPPSIPAAIRTLSLDNAVQIEWAANSEPDLAGYRVWVSDSYDGRFTIIGSTHDPLFIDYEARNGNTYYYAVTAYDLEGNESELSRDVAYDTPRPEGFGVQIYDYLVFPATAGYDFSTYSIGQYDDNYTDIFFENYNGVYYLNVWDDTDIQDMGYTSSLDEISVAPEAGWSPSKYVEAIVGHTYVVWTWDDHYAKVRVKSITSNSVTFDWAYQVSPSNPELKRAPLSGGRKISRQVPEKQ